MRSTKNKMNLSDLKNMSFSDLRNMSFSDLRNIELKSSKSSLGRQQSFSSLPPVIRNKYHVEKTLENGVFGEVLKAYTVSGSSNDEQSPVTIRTFRESHKTMEELDLTELDTLAQLQHVNLVKIFDMVWNINSAGVELYLVYHYCDRGDLALYLQDVGPMSERCVQSFLQQMIQGMQALRRHNIVHRDLKPPNVLVESNKGSKDLVTFKIADLGLTKLFFDEQSGVAFSDYPTFVAPEVLQGCHMSENGDKIDLWSLGVLLLYCLAGGEVPFNGADQFQEERDVDVAGQLPRSTTKELADLIEALLRVDPVDRMDFPSLLRAPFALSPIWFMPPFRHSLPCRAPVTALCLDATLLFCGLEDGFIDVFDRRSFIRAKRLDFHRKTVTALAANHEIIISGSQDTTIAVWSRERFERLQVLYHHKNTVIGIEIIGTNAYSACLDGTHKTFSIDFKKLYARKDGFGQRRFSIQDTSNAEFREELDFRDDRSGKVYPCHWRDHDHMHTTAGLIVVLVFVAEDGEFRPFHVLSSRAFNCLQPQIVVRMRDDGNEHHVRKITFESHLRQVQKRGDDLLFLHWDGRISLFSSREILSQMPNDELSTRTLVKAASLSPELALSTWFCVHTNALAYYHGDTVTLLEYKL